MRILLCSNNPLSIELGAPKVIVELGEALRRQGVLCDVVGLMEVGGDRSLYQEDLRSYLLSHACEYDVVDYDHECLPFPRSDFDPTTLFVARSVLLAHHLETIGYPSASGLRPLLGKLLMGKKRQDAFKKRIQRAAFTIQQANLVNVSNQDDRDELMRRGVPAEKIIVLPFGISQQRRALFDVVPSAVPEQPLIAFVGTFDYRKGATDFPLIVQYIVNEIPNVRFRLLGTAGMFSTAQKVLNFFSPHLRNRIEVIPRYESNELPAFLEPCSIGIFPSYIEGFPFAVLEMLAASLPVIAYNSPGPPMMLPAEYLVSRGDTYSMAAKAIKFLNDPVALANARIWAKIHSQKFNWENVARETYALYKSKMLRE